MPSFQINIYVIISYGLFKKLKGLENNINICINYHLSAIVPGFTAVYFYHYNFYCHFKLIIMNAHKHYKSVINDLQTRGYSEDFILFGNDLLWVQQKTFLAENDFCIMECYRLGHPNGNEEDLVLFAVLTTFFNVKGILMNHYSYTSKIPMLIVKKLNEMTNVVVTETLHTS